MCRYSLMFLPVISARSCPAQKTFPSAPRMIAWTSGSRAVAERCSQSRTCQDFTTTNAAIVDDNLREAVYTGEHPNPSRVLTDPEILEVVHRSTESTSAGSI